MNSKKTKSLNPKSQIIDYLESHGVASEDELAQKLNLHIFDVLNALFELEEKGVTVRVDEVEPLGN